MSDTPTPAALTPQAWTDERIYESVFDRTREDFSKSLYVATMEVAIEMRDDLATTIATQAAELETLRQRNNDIMGIGTPYLDGLTEQELEHYAQLSPPEMFRLLLNAERQLAEATAQMIDLKDKRLCRAVEDAAPQPDWSSAPARANWWAVEPDGGAGWYEYEPEVNDDEWYPGDESYVTSDGWWNAGQVDIPLGIDWRLLKVKRPDSEQATKGVDDGSQ